MIEKSVEELISEMQEVKTEHSILSILEVLKIFEIQAMKELSAEIKALRINK